MQYGQIPDLESKLRKSWRKKTPSEKPQLLREEVTEEDIAEVVSGWTHIPVSRLQEGEREKLVKMEERLMQARHRPARSDRRRLERGPPRARRSAGRESADRFLYFSRPDRRRQNRTLPRARRIFVRRRERDDPHRHERIHGEAHRRAFDRRAVRDTSATRKAGSFREAVRRKPYSVILFDEIEKAHGDVFNVLLQVLDDGRITDGQGRTVDFKNTVIIMTSNIGSQFITGSRPRRSARALVMEALRQPFPSGVSEPRRRDHHLRSAERRRPEEDRRDSTPSPNEAAGEPKDHSGIKRRAKARIAHEGYDPVYGARPLKRAIQKEILDPLSLQILDGKFHEGQTVRVDAKNGALSFDAVAS